jgi:hypothetical protein
MPAVYIYRRSFKKMKIQQKSLFTALTNADQFVIAAYALKRDNILF